MMSWNHTFNNVLNIQSQQWYGEFKEWTEKQVFKSKYVYSSLMELKPYFQ